MTVNRGLNHGKFVVSIGNLYYISIDCYLAFRVMDEEEGWKNVYEELMWWEVENWSLKMATQSQPLSD